MLVWMGCDMKKNTRHSIYATAGVVACIFSLVVAPVAGAVFDEAFYSSNDILFFNADDTDTCSVNGGVGFSAKDNLDYAGNTVLTEAQMQTISSNQPIYQEAAQVAGIPWQLLAAMHMRESGLRRVGPSNGYGPYQITPSSQKVGALTDDEFKTATKEAANFMKAKAGGKDLSNPNNVKYVFFAYNGMSDAYKNQAKALGFTDEQANNGEGSPYVMNRSDLKRDPTATPTSKNNTWGQIKVDHGSIAYPANRDYGAFVYYSVLAGVSSSTCASGANGGLTTGGMTKAQAEAFMLVYSSDPNNRQYIGSSSCGCKGGCLRNCTSFSTYFINKYTTIAGFTGSPRGGNGNQIVPNIIARNPNIQHGTVPRPYAIFSNPAYSAYGPSSAGHTGVILGVDTANNTAIIGEASCSRASISVRTYPLSQITDNSSWLYAYSDGYLKDTGMGL